MFTQHPRWLHHLVKPLTGDFTLKWWGGVELARRMLLLIFIVAFPNDNVSGHSSIVSNSVDKQEIFKFPPLRSLGTKLIL